MILSISAGIVRNRASRKNSAGKINMLTDKELSRLVKDKEKKFIVSYGQEGIRAPTETRHFTCVVIIVPTYTFYRYNIIHHLFGDLSRRY